MTKTRKTKAALFRNILDLVTSCYRVVPHYGALSHYRVIPQHSFVFVIIERNVGDIISDAMFLRIVAIVVEKRVIYLLLVRCLRLFFFLDEVDLGLLKLRLQSSSFFFNFCLGRSQGNIFEF